MVPYDMRTGTDGRNRCDFATTHCCNVAEKSPGHSDASLFSHITKYAPDVDASILFQYELPLSPHIAAQVSRKVSHRWTQDKLHVMTLILNIYTP